MVKKAFKLFEFVIPRQFSFKGLKCETRNKFKQSSFERISTQSFQHRSLLAPTGAELLKVRKPSPNSVKSKTFLTGTTRYKYISHRIMDDFIFGSYYFLFIVY